MHLIPSHLVFSLMSPQKLNSSVRAPLQGLTSISGVVLVRSRGIGVRGPWLDFFEGQNVTLISGEKLRGADSQA
jgi:hypothetical protein